MKNEIIKNVFAAFILLFTIVSGSIVPIRATDLAAHGKRNFTLETAEALEIIAAYTLQTEGRNGAYAVKYFEIRRGTSGEDYWMDWHISKYRSSGDQAPVEEWSSGGGNLKKGVLEVQLTGDTASGSECYLSLTFSAASATIVSDGCTQKNKPDGIYTRQNETAEQTAANNNSPAPSTQETRSEQQEQPVENYYLSGTSPKLGKFENTLDVTRNRNNSIYVALGTNWYKTIRRKQQPQYDLRGGDLKLKGNVAKGVLIGDTSDTGWCEVTLTFTGKTVKLQTGKCDLSLPASGVYTQK